MKFLEMGSKISLMDDTNLTIHDTLPSDIYYIDQDGNLEKSNLINLDIFKKSSIKLYGDLDDYYNKLYRYIDNADYCPSACLISGPKGSGKTILTMHICYSVIGIFDYCVLIVNNPVSIDLIIKLIKDIKRHVVIVIDDFDKLFKESKKEKDWKFSDQSKLAKFLDLKYYNGYKTIFLLTATDVHDVNSKLLNRPDRVKYHIVLKPINDSIILEYCKDHLKRDKRVNDIIEISKLSTKFTFDMLKTIVDEINEYDISITEIFKYLNINKDPVEIHQNWPFEISVKYKDNLIFSKKRVYNYYDFLYNFMNIEFPNDYQIENYGIPKLLKEELYQLANKKINLNEMVIVEESENVKNCIFKVLNKYDLNVNIKLINPTLKKFAHCNPLENDMYEEEYQY